MLAQVGGEGLQVDQDRPVRADVHVAGQRVPVDGARRQVRGERGGGRGEAVPALAQIRGVRGVDHVAREPQPAFHPAQQLAGRQLEGGREGQFVDEPEQRRHVPGLGRPHRFGQPPPHGHRVPFDGQRRRLGRPHRRDARLLQPERDGQFPAGPAEEFGVAAHLDREVPGGEHRVLAERQQPRLGRRAGQHSRRGQHLPRPCLVHRPAPPCPYRFPPFVGQCPIRTGGSMSGAP
ncbi:hypothetical protein RKD37_002367 [Streptomyces ambofaciens]